MHGASRRDFMVGALTAAFALVESRAEATLVRGLTLSELVSYSQHIAVLEPLEARSSYVEIGGRRSMVTDTLARVVEAWGPAPAETEVVVRALGGRIGNVGEIVHGQPQLRFGVVCVGFLTLGRDGAHWMTGMAQGHYPLAARLDDAAPLQQSPDLPSIVRAETSAVRRLVGQQLGHARELVRQARQP